MWTYLVSGLIIVFIGLVSSLIAFFNIPIAIAIAIIAAGWVTFAQHQSDKLKRTEDITSLVLLDLVKSAAAENVMIVKQLASDRQYNSILVNIMIGSLVTPDPTERYWLYIMLGMTKRKRARKALEKGKSDPNPFARGGADKGLEIFKEK